MIKHELAKPEIIDGFSVLKMKQEIQERILRETEGMTDEEVREYIRSGSEKLQAEKEKFVSKNDSGRKEHAETP